MEQCIAVCTPASNAIVIITAAARYLINKQRRTAYVATSCELIPACESAPAKSKIFNWEPEHWHGGCYMSRVKQVSKRTRITKAAGVPALGAAGLSFSLVGGASALPTADLPQSLNTTPNQRFILDEEEMADVSLATFHVFDRENGTPGFRQVAMGCGGCGGCASCGCGGCGGSSESSGRSGGSHGGGCGNGGCCVSWGGCRHC